MSGASEDEGFLTRWSRRKRQPAEDHQPASDAAPAVAPEPAPEPEHDEPLVEPPALTLIDKDFDVAHWLKQNVPEAWKLAAMRLAWETDPAIRDFENPARDYALDWNTPGGAPGYGPLHASDDVEAMVKDIFGPDPQPPSPALAEAGDGMTPRLSSYDNAVDDDAAGQQEDQIAEEAQAVRLSEPLNLPAKRDIPTVETCNPGETVFAAVQNNPDREVISLRTRTRGGGAIPR